MFHIQNAMQTQVSPCRTCLKPNPSAGGPFLPNSLHCLVRARFLTKAMKQTFFQCVGNEVYQNLILPHSFPASVPRKQNLVLRKTAPNSMKEA